MEGHHAWELEKRPYIVLHLDAVQRGVGKKAAILYFSGRFELTEFVM